MALTRLSGLQPGRLALAAFGLLQVWRVPPWLVVVLTALGGMGIAAIR